MMLDQMFTAENFRRIYDAENRKGIGLATHYFSTLDPFTLAVRDKAQDIRDLRKIEATLAADDFETQLLGEFQYCNAFSLLLCLTRGKEVPTI